MREDADRADECEKLLRVLAEGPMSGLTSDGIRESLGWADRKVHSRLIDLGRQVGHEKRRPKGMERETYYFIKRD